MLTRKALDIVNHGPCSNFQTYAEKPRRDATRGSKFAPRHENERPSVPGYLVLQGLNFRIHSARTTSSTSTS